MLHLPPVKSVRVREDLHNVQHRNLRAIVVGFAALLTVALPAAAQAQTLPGSRNLVALATSDMKVAVTFWAPETPQTQADAGAFSTALIHEFGLVGISSFEPQANPDSQLVCSSSVNPVETVGVYGIRGDGVREAVAMCTTMELNGSQIDWAN
jgi:hypothetical protein